MMSDFTKGVVIIGVIVILGLIWLGGSGSETTNEPKTDEPVEQIEIGPTVECEGVPEALVSKIESKINASGKSSLSGAKAVRFNNETDIWYVAARIVAPGLEDSRTIGVWSVDKLDGEAAIYSVDGTARSFSDFIRAGNRVSNNTTAREVAKNCVK